MIIYFIRKKPNHFIPDGVYLPTVHPMACLNEPSDISQYGGIATYCGIDYKEVELTDLCLEEFRVCKECDEKSKLDPDYKK